MHDKNRDPITPAREVTLEDFAKLKSGQNLRFFLGNTNQDNIDWMHDRVEKDLIYGAAKIAGGPNLPIDCYIEDSGFGLFFDTVETAASKSSLQENISGLVFSSMPLPSQLPKRWRPSESGPRYGTFSNSEQKRIGQFVDTLNDTGFVLGPTWRGSGYDIRLPIWETSWTKKDCNFSIHLQKERRRILKPSVFLVSVTDHSHRPVWKRGTSIINENDLSLDEAIKVMESGIDLVWARSR